MPHMSAATAGQQPPDVLDVSYFSFFDGWENEAYALDAQPRQIDPSERVRCDPHAMARHRSRTLRYTVTVHPAFSERLQRFDALVEELAIKYYGRAPRRLVHRGAFACRSSRAN